MERRAFVALLVALVLGPLLWGAAATGRQSDKSTKGVIFGAGSRPCGEWAKNKSVMVVGGGPAVTREEGIAWVSGWVSGATRYDPRSLARPEPASVTASLERYCAAHPLDRLWQAGEAIVNDLAPRATAPRP
jgi:hypothetical protein